MKEPQAVTITQKRGVDEGFSWEDMREGIEEATKLAGIPASSRSSMQLHPALVLRVSYRFADEHDEIYKADAKDGQPTPDFARWRRATSFMSPGSFFNLRALYEGLTTNDKIDQIEFLVIRADHYQATTLLSWMLSQDIITMEQWQNTLSYGPRPTSAEQDETLAAYDKHLFKETT